MGEFFDRFLNDRYSSGDWTILMEQCGYRDLGSNFHQMFEDSGVPNAPHFETAHDNAYALIYALIERDRQLEPWTHISADPRAPLGAAFLVERSYLIFSNDEDAVLARMLIDG